MEPIRRAVIDIGTNSVKLLVADVLGGCVTPVFEVNEQTRLGAGFFGTNRLQPDSITHTAHVVASFVAKTRELRGSSLRVIATSAARDAVNPTELTSAIEAAAGVKVEIISGDEEADLSFQGVSTDLELAQSPLLLVDVGGGSTEFILGQKGKTEFRKSFQLGTVRLLEQLRPSDPPDAQQLADCRKLIAEFLDRHIRAQLIPLLQQRHSQLVATGGTATILARMEARLETYDRKIIESTRLSAARMREHAGQLWAVPLAERKSTVGLPANRADVILAGVVIYEQLMASLGFSELRITTRGLRFGALLAAPVNN